MIRWEDRSYDKKPIHFGYVKSLAPHHKYFVGEFQGKPIIADVYKDGSWTGFDTPFDTIEEAKQWCEMIEVTGAY